MRKTMLILTDFSANATHAAKWGAVWTEKLQGNILLYNTFYNHPLTPTYAGGSLMVEELIFRKDESLSKLDRLAFQLKCMIEDMSADRRKPEISFQNGKGRLGANISTILKEKNIAFVIMGGSLNGVVNHAFFGWDTMDVINHSDCPVIVIPQKADITKIQKVTIASAFEIEDINAIDYLIKLSGQLNFQLEIVHVSLTGQNEDKTRLMAFRTHLSYLEGANVTYREIKGKNVVARLNKQCKQNGSDMLALVHYEHGFLTGIFNKGTTKQALSHQTLPLLIIPSQISVNEKS